MYKLILALVALSLYAQTDTTKTWTNKIVTTFNFSDSKFDNWAAGGEDAMNWQFDLRASFVKDIKAYNWANNIKLVYGQTKIKTENVDETRKTSDEIKLETVFTYKLAESLLNPYVAATGQTQFTKSYNYATDPNTEISGYADPIILTQSAGFGYINGVLKMRLGYSIKETMAEKFAATFSDDPETPDEIEDLRIDHGMEIVTDYNKMISELINYTAKLELFTDFSGIKYVDVAWDNMFSAKISDWLVTSLNYKIVYDNDIHWKRQSKRVFSAGVTYSFL